MGPIPCELNRTITRGRFCQHLILNHSFTLTIIGTIIVQALDSIWIRAGGDQSDTERNQSHFWYMDQEVIV